jgi:hypothetical protein
MSHRLKVFLLLLLFEVIISRRLSLASVATTGMLLESLPWIILLRLELLTSLLISQHELYCIHQFSQRITYLSQNIPYLEIAPGYRR